MHVSPDGEEENVGVKRARNGGLLVKRVPERSSGSSEGEGGRTLERSISGGSLLTLVAVRLGREVALRLVDFGVARGVRITSRGGVGRAGTTAGELDGLRGRNGVRRLALSPPSLGVADARERDERIRSISRGTKTTIVVVQVIT